MEPHNQFLPRDHMPVNQPQGVMSPPSAPHHSQAFPHQAQPAVMAAPEEPTNSLSINNDDPVRPVPVVRVLSPRGVEYVMLTIALFFAAGSLIGALLALVNGETDFSTLSFPTATLLVSVPVFAFFFLRLKRAELANPELKLDQSKRRSTQFTQIAAFFICFATLIGVIAELFSVLGGSSETSISKILLNGLVVIAVAGAVLAYYWQDEHRK